MSDAGDVTDPRTEAAAAKTKKGTRGLDDLAMRELRQARKLFRSGEPSAAEASFLVASANVLAMLDLAAAIREAKGSSSEE